MSSVSPGGADLVPTTPDWPAWVGFMVTTHFDLVSGPFHSPIFIGLHSVSTSDNMYHLHMRAGELPRSASSHFYYYYYQIEFWSIVKVALVSEELCLLASFSKPTLLLVPDQVPLAKWNIVQLFITCDTAFWDIKGFFKNICLLLAGPNIYTSWLSILAVTYTKISKGSKGEVYSSLWARNPGGRNWGGISSSCCFSCTLRRLKSCSSTTCPIIKDQNIFWLASPMVQDQI